MLLDHRTYTVRAGTLRKQLALYEKHGFAAQMHVGEEAQQQRIIRQRPPGADLLIADSGRDHEAG